MAIAKKLRFIENNVDVILDTATIPFPPTQFKAKGMRLSLLGVSNKQDLYPCEEEYNVGLLKAVQNKEIGQFTYCSEIGDIYEAFIYINEAEEVILRGFRTRFQ